jgi:hypothetical protein
MNIKKDGLITRFILWIDGFMFGVLVLSRFFQQYSYSEYDTQTMSDFWADYGWGCVFYIGFQTYHKVKWLIGVFAIEKIDLCNTLDWMLNNTLSKFLRR